MSDLEAAWDELHDAKPDHWHVGWPSYDENHKEWVPFDPRER